jgi:hypothetical protein
VKKAPSIGLNVITLMLCSDRTLLKTILGAIAREADILRIHDLAKIYDVCQVADAIERSKLLDL